MEIRRQATGVMKILQLAAMKAYEVTHYNITGMELDNSVKFSHQTVCLKKTREFFNKNTIVKTFLKGLDKKDERVFITDTRTQ
jgi:hypothetical protein